MDYPTRIGSEREASGAAASRGRRMRSMLAAAGLAAFVAAAIPVVLQQISAAQFIAQTQLKVEVASEAAVTSTLVKLRSKANLDNLIRALNLSRDSSFAVERSGFTQVLYDIVSGGGITVAEAEATLRDRISQNITLNYDKSRGVLAIAAAAGEAEEAKRLVTMLGNMFADGMTATAEGTPDTALQGLRQALDRAEAALSGFLSKTDASRLAELRRAQGESQSLMKEKAQAEAELAGLRDKLTEASSMKLADVLGKPLPDSLEFTGLEYQRQRYVEAKLAVDQLSSTLGSRHPRLLAAQGALEDVRLEIQQAIGQLVASLQRSHSAAAKHLSELKARQAKLAGDNQTADAAERLAALEAAVAEARQNYSEGRQRRPAASQSAQAAKVHVIQPASIQPEDPAGLSTLQRSVQYGVLGFVLGLALVWFRRRTRKEYHSTNSVIDDVVKPITTVSAMSALEDEKWEDLDLVEDKELFPAASAFAAAEPSPANAVPLADHIRDLLMANRRPVAQAGLPPLVAAVMAVGTRPVETSRLDLSNAPSSARQNAQEILTLRRNMAELREKVQHYSAGRQASRR